MKNWQSWSNILSVLIGLLGIFLAIHFYQISKSKTELVFLIDPIRTILVDSSPLSEQPFRIEKLDGSELHGSISAIRFYLWNNGNQSIKPSNILSPIKILLEDENGQILDYKILKSSRSIINPRLIFDDTNQSELLLTFDILEQDDGITGQLIYEGELDTEIAIIGVIEGSKQIITNSNIDELELPSHLVFYSYFTKTGAILATPIFILLLILYYEHVDKLVSPRFEFLLKYRGILKKLGVLFLIIVLFIIFSILIFAPYYSAKREATENIAHFIPELIKP